MTSFAQRPVQLGQTPSLFTGKPGSGRKPGAKDDSDKAIWVPMLNKASRGKDLVEKQLIVLGGTPEQQREFLETVNPETERPRYQKDRQKKRTPPISNLYALGYTYQDILDADQEDTLARLNVYMLSSPSASFAPLLKPLFTTETVPNTLITILLDWSDPFKWPRQLRQWIRILRSVIITLDEDVKIELQETMTAWKEKRVGPDAPTSMPGAEKQEQKQTQTQTQISPLGPGEWDEELGLPLSVVCVNAEKIERLERDFGWQEEEFDFLLQWLRCVLLKHGSSLIYTTNFDSNNVRPLILSSLSIQSLLKKEIVKHNVIDRDKILVPPNWDSWGKIRILGEGFDPEVVSNAWSTEIQQDPEESIDYDTAVNESSSAIAAYEATLQDPAKEQSYKPLVDTDAEVTVLDTQTFLAEQAVLLEKLKAEDEKTDRRARKGAPAPTGSSQADVDDLTGANARMTEQIGPYQINVNGIDFDAEEATRRIRDLSDRTKGEATPKRLRPGLGSESSDGGKSSEVYSDFFERLKQKGKGRGGGIASGSVSPTRGSPAPER